MADDAKLLKTLKQRYLAMRNEYDANWRPHHKELAENLLPRIGRFLDTDTTENDGKKRYDTVKDGIVSWALTVFAGGMHTGLTSPVSPYFALTLDDKGLAKSKPVKLWLDRVREILISLKNSAKFFPKQHSLYYELGVFGPMVMMIESHPEQIVSYTPLTCGEYVLGVDEFGKINALYRQLNLQIISVVEKFGKENVSKNVLTKYNSGDVQDWVKINHAIEPNDDRVPNKIDGRNKAFRSVYWEAALEDPGKVLRYKGYDTKPFVASTLFNVGSEIYGYSPGMSALADVKELYSKKEHRNKALAKQIGPPLNVPSGMKNSVINVKPNAFNFYEEVTGRGAGGISPIYQINPAYGEIDLDIANFKTQISQHFFTDIFLLLTSSPTVKTAFEAAKLIEEKIKVLGPVVETAQEMQSDILEREYFLLQEAGKIPEPPDELLGQVIRVELISPLAQARRILETSGLIEVTTFVKSLMETHPEAGDKLAADKVVDKFAASVGTDAAIIKDENEVLAIRQAREAEIQSQQLAEENQNLAKGAKDLAQSDLSGDNALTALLGAENA